ncbi:type II secretion system protein GspG [Luteolibacter marinus]|uniref:type II secretion system protein GspG n=1 Tax=Luteolibacter marinus TaxID=2776705 RepID=UPI001D035319|nr:type II secretion system protein GspG [Luteolibacter marinus]
MKSHRVEADFHALGSALKSYVINAKVPPTTEQGLQALVTKPTAAPVPKSWMQMMKNVPQDPWMKEYRYLRFSATLAHYRFELRSAGPDGLFGNADDLAKLFER